ncbi:hypothetical protein LuPra_03300 [Luteitalea pratensis]|uniref:Lipopolysaccharide biosynthesis protein n=1 Tax=Luteitalea pratensis TaxID=1855912 RepID=A0A143PNA2_LUTPR|nr:glycoside hydrolase family 99-like domain-containing protein [Luteitalea pratensis]AMY10072.1 hypothetical protein LuPra_03300 [Luteitalea pratensis]
MTALDDRLNSAEPAPAPVDPSAAARVIAYYLPQYHPIPENDAWWGRGFTEWTNVTKARRRFPGHYQPRLAGELGYYDLRVPEVRAQQAELAREHGVEAFCYYHYWFGTSELLQRPLAEVVASGQPGLSFCVCWANETWTGIWHGNPRQTLIEQTYPGDGDHRRHFESLRPAFEDRRYLRVDGKPVFVVYKPNQVPDAARVCDLWREMAVMAGLGGLHLVGVKNSLEGAPLPPGFDAVVAQALPPVARRFRQAPSPKSLARSVLRRLGVPTVYRYDRVAPGFVSDVLPDSWYPCMIPNWDNSARSGADGLVLHGSTPELFGAQVRRTVAAVAGRHPDKRLVFVKSWNEWAEGNYLEPDQRFGRRYLEALRDEIRPGAAHSRGPSAWPAHGR